MARRGKRRLLRGAQQLDAEGGSGPSPNADPNASADAAGELAMPRLTLGDAATAGFPAGRADARAKTIHSQAAKAPPPM